MVVHHQVGTDINQVMKLSGVHYDETVWGVNEQLYMRLISSCECNKNWGTIIQLD